MKLTTLTLSSALSLFAGTAFAGCAFQNETPIKMLSAGFEAWKAVTHAMSECGNFEAELDQEFRTKQPTAFAARPQVYHIVGVSNGTITPLMNEGTIRPLDNLVEKFGQDLLPNQIITIDGQVMAIAMMVDTQHLMYRKDMLAELGLEVPETWDEVPDAAETMKTEGDVAYPIGATMASGWNIAQDYVNMFCGFGGIFYDEANRPTINNEAGINALKTMKRMTEYMVSASTYVQQRFQQERIAMSNFWASRAAAMNDEGESAVVGLVETSITPRATADGPPAPTIWWDGLVIASNISDAEAEAAFRLIIEGLDAEMMEANPDAAIWLIQGYEPTEMAAGAIATLTAGPAPRTYPSTSAMGLMHTALGNGIPDFLTGSKDADTTLSDIEAAYLTSAR